ncbi:hypothetical protein BJV78DRAFT_1286142 [Lactifluus subvellereus]|nr:hypothetical protein BJV78DRAFT_1286142 [Lactifluus subvellereus]
MYSPKTSHLAEKRRPGSLFLTHPASSPGPRHTTLPPDHPSEHPFPSKRPRDASTLSSNSSLPSTPSRDRSGVDFYQARFESTMRLKDAWARLARPLDEDDIIDLRSEKILKDRGIVRSLVNSTHKNSWSQNSQLATNSKAYSIQCNTETAD